ncbi:MAG: hypothetical protein LBG44_11070 [Gemmatimonadota bacterium]|jgi:hypothetical protein|nr:hypothetical protein [Gemmatimonadota bacterium]
MRSNLVMLLAVVIFLASNIANLYSARVGSPALAIAGGIGNVVAAVLFFGCIVAQRRKAKVASIEQNRQ